MYTCKQCDKQYKTKGHFENHVATHAAEPELASVIDTVEGPLVGEYRFDDLPGSITAKDKQEAIEKYIELKTKYPNYFIREGGDE